MVGRERHSRSVSGGSTVEERRGQLPHFSAWQTSLADKAGFECDESCVGRKEPRGITNRSTEAAVGRGIRNGESLAPSQPRCVVERHTRCRRDWRAGARQHDSTDQMRSFHGHHKSSLFPTQRTLDHDGVPHPKKIAELKRTVSALLALDIA